MVTSSAVRKLDVLIVGAGFAGLYMLLKARKMGLEARAFDRAGGVGGTWYHNRYPGARVDIQSMEYSFSFSDELQQDWHWTERYSSQPEILKYAEHVADRFELRDGIQLKTGVTGAAFDESEARWQVKTDDGQTWSARFLVMATGPLSAPNTPSFPGLESFTGEVLHTANWPHHPVDFTGKRVAVIGTGSSGVQVVPLIAKQAKELTVFQRTATYAVPAQNKPLDPLYEAKVKGEYSDFRARNSRMRGGFGSDLPPNPVSALSVSAEERETMFEERWAYGGFSFLGAFNDLNVDMKANGLAAEFVRTKIRSIVKDPETALLLSPQHTIGCKRLCIDSGYYETFNRPNVILVDVGSHPIDEITATGLRADGRDFDFDVLVLATGFDAMTGTLMKLDLQGRGGLRIQDKWEAGPRNYLGLMVAGFPNMFNVAGPGSTLPFTNAIVCIEQHVNWISDCIAHLDKAGYATIDPTDEAESNWIEHVNTMAKPTLFLTCNSWYLGANIPGKPRMFMPLAGGFPPYAARCADVASKDYEGFALA